MTPAIRVSDLVATDLASFEHRRALRLLSHGIRTQHLRRPDVATPAIRSHTFSLHVIAG